MSGGHLSYYLMMMMMIMIMIQGHLMKIHLAVVCFFLAAPVMGHQGKLPNEDSKTNLLLNN